MKTKKPTNSIISVLLLCTLSSTAALAQVSEPTTPLKTQKYNGYGLPNTKFKKIKVDLTKKKNGTPTTATMAPSIEATPVKLVPKSSMQPDNTIMAAAKPAPEKKLVKLSMDYDLSYNAQMQTQENNARDEYLVHELMPKITIDNYSIMGDFLYRDDRKDTSANEWQDSAVVLSRKSWELGRIFTLAPALTTVLPLSKKSREDAGIKYLIGPTLTLGLNTKNLGLDSFKLNYAVRYLKYQTEFKTKPNGDPSGESQIRQRVTAIYQFTDKFSATGVFDYKSGYSTENTIRNSYWHAEVLGYQITDMFALYIAHSTGGSVYSISENAVGYVLFENDLKFYDPKASEIAIGTTISF